CAMIPAAPARTAGLVRSDPGLVEIWSHDLIEPGLPTIAWLTPGVLLFIRPYFLTSCADSGVSLTQRPEVAAIPEPACATTAPVPATDLSRCSPRSFDDSPSETRKRSTSVGFPMTASPSPSLIS